MTTNIKKLSAPSPSPRIQLRLYPNVRETVWVVTREGAPTNIVVRKAHGQYAIDTFAFSYGDKPLFATLRAAREHLAASWAYWPPFALPPLQQP